MGSRKRAFLPPTLTVDWRTGLLQCQNDKACSLSTLRSTVAFCFQFAVDPQAHTGFGKQQMRFWERGEESSEREVISAAVLTDANGKGRSNRAFRRNGVKTADCDKQLLLLRNGVKRTYAW